MEPLEDVRVRYFDKKRGQKELVPTCDARIAAHIAINPAVAGLVSVASDYVYDEKKHGPILSSLLHGVKIDHRRVSHDAEETEAGVVETGKESEGESDEDDSDLRSSGSSSSRSSSRSSGGVPLSLQNEDADDMLSELDYDFE